MSKTADRLDRLEAKLDEIIALLRILALRGGDRIPEPLEDGDDLVIIPTPFPVPPHFPTPQPEPYMPARSTCSKCGMDFSGVTGYVCNNMDCPMGMGPTICGEG